MDYAKLSQLLDISERLALHPNLIGMKTLVDNDIIQFAADSQKEVDALLKKRQDEKDKAAVDAAVKAKADAEAAAKAKWEAENPKPGPRAIPSSPIYTSDNPNPQLELPVERKL